MPKDRHGTNFFTIISKNRPISVTFYDARGDMEDLYSRLKPIHCFEWSVIKKLLAKYFVE